MEKLMLMSGHQWSTKTNKFNIEFSVRNSRFQVTEKTWIGRGETEEEATADALRQIEAFAQKKKV